MEKKNFLSTGRVTDSGVAGTFDLSGPLYKRSGMRLLKALGFRFLLSV